MSRTKLFLLLLVTIILIAIWLWFFPPRWWLNTVKSVDLADPVGAGMGVVDAYDCRQCHLIGGEGKAVGPNLANVTQRLDAAALRAWLRAPQPPMPNFHLSDEEIEAIASYLAHLDRTRD